MAIFSYAIGKVSTCLSYSYSQEKFKTENRKKWRTHRFARRNASLLCMPVMKLRCLRDLKQWFRYKYLDLRGWTENRSLGYRVQHGEDAGGWRQKAFGWGRATRAGTSFQNKGSCPYCERLHGLFGKYGKHMGSPRGLEALMIPSSVQSNPLFHIPRASHDIFGHIISNLDHWLQGCLLLTTAYPPTSAISCSYLA